MCTCECGMHETEINGFKMWTEVVKPLPGINLTTGEKMPVREKEFLALTIDDGEGCDYVRINYCPWCGLEMNLE